MKTWNRGAWLASLLSISLTFAAYAQRDHAEEARLIPALDAELFSVDGAHSNLFFSIGFLGFNEVQGTFGTWNGTLLHNEDDRSKLSITLSVDATSIDTGLDMRDKDLRSENFFDTENHGRILFQSTRSEPTETGAIVHGTLTMRGVEKEIAVPVTQTVNRQADNAWGNVYIGFEGEVTINRRDFGIEGGRFWGAKALSEDVKIGFSILASRANTNRWGQGEQRDIVAAIVEDVQTNGLESALTMYETQATEIPLNPMHISLIGKRLVQAGYIAEAVPFFKLAIDANPDRAANHYLDLAEAYALQDNRTEAIAAYRYAEERIPHHTTMLEVLRHLE